MREFLAIIITLSIGFFLTTVLAYSLERRQLDNTHVDMEADVRAGIILVSRSGYAVKVLPETPQAAELPAPGQRNDI